MADDRGGGTSKWTMFQIFIAVLMVSTGSVNTLAAKWADKLTADGRTFDHPFVQAICMFIGEFFCLPAFFIVFGIRKWQYIKKSDHERDLGPLGPIADDSGSGPPIVKWFNPLIFFPAAMCDLCATSIMYIGLNLTNAASFQMLRGSVIIFTGLLSVAFLRSVLRCYKWVGMISVFFGLIVVGLSDILFGEKSSSHQNVNGIISGDLLIIMAQIIVAIQMVYEQKVITKYDVPALLAVGCEGLFGMTVLSILCVPFYFIKVPTTFSNDPDCRLENALEAFKQLGDNPLIIVALMGTIFSIAFFNFAGVSVTKELSATTRMVLDSVRVLVIWAFGLIVKWSIFVPLSSTLQIIGFILLFFGLFVYNDLIFGPLFRNRFLPWLDYKGVHLPRIQACCMPDLLQEDDDMADLVRPSETTDPVVA